MPKPRAHRLLHPDVRLTALDVAAPNAALRRLCDLFALWALEKQTGLLFEGGYFVSGAQSKALKRAIIDLSAVVKVRPLRGKAKRRGRD